MSRKMYEIILPPNSDSTFWIDDGKMYYHLDREHPFPYDKQAAKWEWSPKTSIQRKYEFPLLTRLHIPLFAISDIPEHLASFVEKEFIDNSHYADTPGNIIVVHRKIANSKCLIGVCIVENVTTDRPINWVS